MAAFGLVSRRTGNRDLGGDRSQLDQRGAQGKSPEIGSWIYLVDFTGATDVTEVPSLIDGGFTQVTKTLLWQGCFRSSVGGTRRSRTC